MADNVGLGFIFGATTKPFQKGIKVAESGIDKIRGALESTADFAKSNPFGSVLDALNFGALSDIRDQIGGVVGMDQDVARLTSTMEAYGTTVDEAFSATAAGLNLTAKETAKWRKIVGSAALATNTDVNTAVGAFEALNQQQLDLAKIGIPTFEDYLKLIKTTGVDQGTFTKTLGQLNKEFGLSEGQIGGLLDDFAELSKRGNLGAGALGAMTDQLDTLRPLLLDTMKRKGPDAVATMLRSTQALAGVFQEAFGGDPQDNLKDSLAITEALAKSQFDLQGAFVGMEDIPNLQTNIAQSFGSMQQAQELLSTDSTTFIKKLRAMAGQLERDSPGQAAVFLERMSRQLGEVAPGIGKVLTAGVEMDQAFAKLGDPRGPIEGATGALNRMTEAGFRTGRTLSENVQLSLDGFEQKIRDIRGAEIDKMFTDEVIPAIGTFGDEIVALSKDQGPLGFAIGKFSEFQKIGAAAFLPLDTEYGKKLFILGQVLGPVVGQMGPFLAALAPLAALLPMVVSGLAGLGTMGLSAASGLLGLAGSAVGAIGAVGAWPATLGLVAAGIASVLAGIALLGPAIVGLGTDAGGTFTEMLNGWIDSAVKFVDSFVPTIVGGLNSLAAMIRGGELSGELGEGMATWLRNAFTKGLDRFGSIIESVGGFGPAISAIGSALGDVFVAAGERAWAELLAQRDRIFAFDSRSMAATLRASLFAAFTAAMVGLASMDLLGPLTEGADFADGLLDMFENGLDTMDFPAIAQRNGEMFLDAMLGFFSGPAASDVTGSAFVDLFKNIDWDRAWKVVQRLGGITDRMTQLGGRLVLEMGEGMLRQLPFVLAGLGVLLAGIFRDAFKFTLTTVVPFFIKKFAEGMVAWGTMVTETIGGMKETLSNSLLSPFFTFQIGALEMLETVFAKVTEMWDFVVGLFGNSINEVIGADFDQLAVRVGNAFVAIRDIAVGTADSIIGTVSSGIKRAMTTISAPVEFLKGVASSLGITNAAEPVGPSSDEQARAAGRREVLAAGGKSEMETLIGVVKTGLDQLHEDLMLIHSANRRSPGAKASPLTSTLGQPATAPAGTGVM